MDMAIVATRWPMDQKDAGSINDGSLHKVDSAFQSLGATVNKQHIR